MVPLVSPQMASMHKKWALLKKMVLFAIFCPFLVANECFQLPMGQSCKVVRVKGTMGDIIGYLGTFH